MADLNEGRLDLPRSRARFIAFGVAAIFLFMILGGRLFQMQIVNGEQYAARAAATRTIEVPLRSARGLVFDREGRPVVVNVPSWTVKIRPADLPDSGPKAILRRVAQLTGTKAATLRARLDAFKGSPFELVPIARGVSRRAALLIGEEAQSLPGVVVEVDPVREYLDEKGRVDGTLLSHVLGYVGPINAGEYVDLKDNGYQRDDLIGRAGIEATYEKQLRGEYGSELMERDAQGRPVKTIRTEQEPKAGSNLMLTIDARMQRIATKALRWGMRAAGLDQGVTVVMNPQTGEILAMVSLPAYDNNKFATGISTKDYSVYLNDPAKPLRNHAIADIFPPGSTFKLVTGLAALEEGVTTPTRPWQTYGCYQIPDAPKGQCLFDWNHAGFGQVNLVQAFALSSDTFFYQMAVALGVDRLGDWAHELGFGEKSGIRLPGEAAGIVASREWARSQGREDVFTGELAQAGIGQNVVAVTPLQLLNAYAAVANGGRLMQPMIVRGETDASGKLTKAYKPRMIRRIKASASNLQTMRIGAREVITTGHAYNIRDLHLHGALSGKTGTAEFGTRGKNGVLPFHSWFVAYLPSKAGATDADLAIVTFSYSAVVPGNVSLEVVKYFLQQWYGLHQDLRLDPRDFSLVAAN
ncbi:MAG TPA: penicillin-binding protein 2 [Candidatus Limnocylindria bacterium]|nr:penicillin-binding protein 2 [Candidatus Limnocylindria bacterium]